MVSVSGDVGAAVDDVADQVGFAHHNRGVEQADAVRQHVGALVVVEHPGDRAALDDGQHHQHRVGRIAQHEPDDVGRGRPCRQHRGVAVDDRRLGVGDRLLAEPDEDPVAVAAARSWKTLAMEAFEVGVTSSPVIAPRRITGASSTSAGNRVARSSSPTERSAMIAPLSRTPVQRRLDVGHHHQPVQRGLRDVTGRHQRGQPVPQPVVVPPSGGAARSGASASSSSSAVNR